VDPAASPSTGLNPAAPNADPMDPMALICAFYPPGTEGHKTLVQHSRCVAEKALAAAGTVRHLNPDLLFIEEAALLHDIGIFLTNSPELGCRGLHPYICHGYLGRELLDKKGFPRHALVCERHVGVGISPADITRQGLPLPNRDMRPVTLEEQIVCYADKFFSKDNADPEIEKPVADILKMLAAFGPVQSARFESWAKMFGDL